MIDPTNITNFNLSDTELEERILFWVCAAGKNGTTAAKCLDKLLKNISGPYDSSPMAVIFRANSLFNLSLMMKDAGIGCYNNKSKTFVELSKAVLNRKLNLKTCTTEELETIYGIGMKTSRCFIIHSRANSNYAGIDTHMLKNLRAHGIPDVPLSTPTNKKLYKKLELEVLKLAEQNNMSATDYDLMIWNKYKK